MSATVGERRDPLGVVGVRVNLADRVRQPDDHLLESLRRAIAARRFSAAGCSTARRSAYGGCHSERRAKRRAASPPRRAARQEMKRIPVVIMLSSVSASSRDQAHQLPGSSRWKRTDTRHVGARCEIERMIADLLDRRCDRENVVGGQPGRAPEALVAVARRGVDDLDRSGSRLHPEQRLPLFHQLRVLRTHLDDGSFDPGGNRVHHLHHLDQADGRARVDACSDIDERRCPGASAR